jgi:hypothetical protein
MPDSISKVKGYPRLFFKMGAELLIRGNLTAEGISTEESRAFHPTESLLATYHTLSRAV